MSEQSSAALLSRRWINFLGFLSCAGLLGFGYYLQYQQGLEPCPLCIFQRVAFFALGVWFLIAALHNPSGWGAIAGRQVWLQGLPPDQVPDCGPGLNYMLDMFPLMEVVSTVLRGSGDCAEVDWVFLGLSIAGWALLLFIALGVVGFIRNLITSR
jgi:disulfide bond formation protein DsbB